GLAFGEVRPRRYVWRTAAMPPIRQAHQVAKLTLRRHAKLITARLIKSADGTQVSAEDYDRQLTDIFAIQEDIARTIATSLRMPLGLKPGQNLVNNRTLDPASYQDFLRAKALLRTPGGRARETATLLESILVRHPEFAP